MREDPIVAEVRRIREALAAQSGFDVSAIFTALRKSQAALGSRLVRRGKKQDAQRAAAAAADRRCR